MPTDDESAQASAKAVQSNLGGKIRERTSEPDATKSSYIRMTWQEESDNRQTDLDGQED